MCRWLLTLRVFIAGMLLALPHGAAWAAHDGEEIVADRIRAAYILKFLEYVDWPESLFGHPAAPYVVGVSGSGYVADELARLAPSRTSGGRSIVIRRMNAGAGPVELHALYVGRHDRGSGARLAKSYAGKPVLIITDDEAAVPEASVINFVPLERRVRFEVSLVNAEKAGLKLSSRLLSVAVRVYKGELPGDSDVADAPSLWPSPASGAWARIAARPPV